ncbi:MAG: PadR family transcriptional regulator [Candidatus Thorarchaeota archaeon]
MMSKETPKKKTRTGQGGSKKSYRPMEPLPIVRALFLVFIRRHPDSTGYDLMGLISDSTNGLVELKSGTVYSELRRLEALGFVTSAQEEKGRKRRAYVITKSGIKELSLLAKQMQMRVDLIIMPLLKLIEDKKD